jgi:hypothetical protein
MKKVGEVWIKGTKYEIFELWKGDNSVVRIARRVKDDV